MNKLPQISEAEWAVMETVWESAPIAAADIIERLAGPRQWKHQTIRTLLARLVKKQALAAEQHGNRYIYRPLVEREALVRAESASFLQRVFAGAAQPLLVHFASQAKLTRVEIAELQRILKGEDKS